MGSTNDQEKEYAAFLEKVKRTVYFDNVSPKANTSVFKTALSQFGTVTEVTPIPNYFESGNCPKCFLIEMENEKQAKSIVELLKNYPFQISGMPRPVKCRRAVPEMFDERPSKPGRKITFRWVNPGDPDFEVAQKIKEEVKKQAGETSLLLKFQREEELKLHEQQVEFLKSNYKKFEMLDNITHDGSVKKLGQAYDVKITED